MLDEIKKWTPELKKMALKSIESNLKRKSKQRDELIKECKLLSKLITLIKTES